MQFESKVNIEEKTFLDKDTKQPVPYLDCSFEFKGETIKVSVKKESRDLLKFLMAHK